MTSSLPQPARDAMLPELLPITRARKDTRDVFTLELDEPQRLLGLAVAILLGLAIIGIGLVGGLKARLATSAPRT